MIGGGLQFWMPYLLFIFIYFGTKRINKYAKQFLIHHFYFQHPSLWFLALHLQTVCSNVKSTNWLSLSKVLHSVLKGKAIDDSAGNTWSRSTSAFMKPLSSAVSGEKLQFNLIISRKIIKAGSFLENIEEYLFIY